LRKYLSHLEKPEQKHCKRLIDEYGITDEAGLTIIKVFGEAAHRARKCREIIEKEGQTVTDRFEQQKPHPLLNGERDARAQMMAALKMLNLDLEPVGAIGRPPGG